MKLINLTDNVYWVGTVDWNVRDFHGYNTPYGTTYNAYLVSDKKTALIDTVYWKFKDVYLRRIESVTDFDKIDYVIVNHIEYDHSSSLPYLMERVDGEIFCTKRARDVIERIYSDEWSINVVKTGDELSIGNKTFKFIETPMVHWPDTMFTYLVEDEILFPNDGFGQHIASSERFADEISFVDPYDEAAKYYANIIMLYSKQVQKVLKYLKEQNISIKMIAPSHGLIWRNGVEKILDLYGKWSSGMAADKVIIVYDTMWESTEKMAWAIAKGLEEEKMDYEIYLLKHSDWSWIMKEIMLAKGILVGTPTLNRELYPSVAGFLTYMKGLKPINKIASVFGSYGWSGEGVKKAEEMLREGGIEVVDSGLIFRYTPTEDEIQQCIEFGKSFAEKVREKE